MKLPLRIALLLVAAILLPSVATPLAAQERSWFDEITAEMESIRGLALFEPLNITFMTRDEFFAELEGDLLETEDEEVLADDRRVLVTFGFLEPDDDPRELYTALLGESVAGYYDPSTNEMVVITSDEGDELSALEQVTFAHETIHALQDQHFDLDSFREIRLEGTDDASLAVTALIEGDASLAEIDYLLSDLSLARAYLEEIESRSGDMSVLETTPAILVRTLSFPYNEGFAFVQHLHDEGGWNLVNAAYEQPPTTTEQVMHPRKYLDGEGAIEVSVPDLSVALGNDWRQIDENTLGEFIISVLLADSDLGDQQVEVAHTGWGGDSYVAMTDNTDTAIAWVTEWDSVTDADEFLRALVIRESGRLDVDVETDGNVVTLATGEAVVQIVQDGARVTYLQGPDEVSIAAMAETLARGA